MIAVIDCLFNLVICVTAVRHTGEKIAISQPFQLRRAALYGADPANIPEHLNRPNDLAMGIHQRSNSYVHRHPVPVFMTQEQFALGTPAGLKDLDERTPANAHKTILFICVHQKIVRTDFSDSLARRISSERFRAGAPGSDPAFAVYGVNSVEKSVK